MTDDSINRIVQRLLLEQMVNVVPFWCNKKLYGIPKGYKIAVNEVRDEFLDKMKGTHTEGCLLPAEIYCSYSSGH